jgi:hypothetical protein
VAGFMAAGGRTGRCPRARRASILAVLRACASRRGRWWWLRRREGKVVSFFGGCVWEPTSRGWCVGLALAPVIWKARPADERVSSPPILWSLGDWEMDDTDWMGKNFLQSVCSLFQMDVM